MATTASRAWELRSKLFDLVGEVKRLHLETLAATRGASDAVLDEALTACGQLDEIGCRLAAIHDALPEVFADAATDHPRFGFPLD